jgi:hypothetical protein
MTQDQDKNEPNVVNLADARKRQRTVRAGAQAKKAMNGGAKPGATGPKKGFWMYFQLLLFLGIVAYMMQLCRSGT